MILDWQSLQGKLKQDEALDNFERAVADLEAARDDMYKWMWWSAWFDQRKN